MSKKLYFLPFLLILALNSYAQEKKVSGKNEYKYVSSLEGYSLGEYLRVGQRVGKIVKIHSRGYALLMSEENNEIDVENFFEVDIFIRDFKYPKRAKSYTDDKTKRTVKVGDRIHCDADEGDTTIGTIVDVFDDGLIYFTLDGEEHKGRDGLYSGDISQGFKFKKEVNSMEGFTKGDSIQFEENRGTGKIIEIYAGGLIIISIDGMEEHGRVAYYRQSLLKPKFKFSVIEDK